MEGHGVPKCEAGGGGHCKTSLFLSTGGFILVSDYVRMEVTLVGASWDVVAGDQDGCGLHSYDGLYSGFWANGSVGKKKGGDTTTSVWSFYPLFLVNLRAFMHEIPVLSLYFCIIVVYIIF